MQTINLDISNKGVYPCIYAKQSEVGRKFLAVITDGGVSYNIPENSLLSVWYEGDTDAGNYSSIEEKSAFSIDGNKVTVELVAQMLLKPGNGELCLSVTHGDGGETNTWNIPYCVEYKPGAGSSVPTEYYTALTEAGAVAAKYAGEAKQSAEFISALYIESDEHPGCYYRIVNEVVEWINPPMEPGVVYRTTERHNGKAVYTLCVNCGALPNATHTYVNLDMSVNVWGQNCDFFDIQYSVKNANGGHYYVNPYAFHEISGTLLFNMHNNGYGYYFFQKTNFDASGMTGVLTVKFTKE